MQSIAYAEKKMGKSMGTPKKVRDPDQPYAPIKYDVENVQLRDDGPDLTKPAFPLGFANAELVKNKPIEAKVVATQQAYEAAKEADVASRFAADTASAAKAFGHVTHARDSQSQGDFYHEPYPRRELWAGRPDATFLQMDKPAKDPLGAANASHTKGVAEAE